jgi:PTH1 family peptidyl-tRNA hydrolase
MEDSVRLIVGLGNPGEKYEDTRHNAGFWLVDELAQWEKASWVQEKKFFSHCAQFSLNEKICWLLKPLTFMNESGKAIAAFAKFYKISPSAILIAHDELDFPVGELRLRKGGGAGGHNGLKSAISYLQTQDFYRYRIGIGRPTHQEDVVDYVLNKPSQTDRTKIFAAIEGGLQGISDLLKGDAQKAFRELHIARDK